MRGFVLADDLTGANEVAACFAGAGFPVTVRLNSQAMINRRREFVVVDSETRNSSPDQARRLVAKLMRSLGGSQEGTGGSDFDLHFKKIDSTLRGPVGYEVSAMMSTLELAGAVVAPAFPAQGRTTVDGRQLVWGEPVDESPAGRDPVSPALESHLPTLLHEQTGLPVALVPLDTVARGGSSLERALRAALAERRVCVVDAETDEQLTQIAAALLSLGSRILGVGTAGLASGLARNLNIAPDLTHSHPQRPTADAGTLVVCGSLHPASLRQMELLAERVSIFRHSPSGEEGRPNPDTDPLPEVQPIAAALGRGDVLLSSSAIAGRRKSEATAVARELATLARQAIEQRRPRGLVLTGGDTAYQVLQALEADGLELFGEVLPGIPVGAILGGPCHGLPVITKAGGFGEPDVLSRAVAYLGKPR